MKIKPETIKFGRGTLLAAMLLISSLRAEAAYNAQEFGSVITSRESQIENYRNQEIKQLQLILSRSSAGEKQHDMLLRLAELYTEKYKLYFLKENEIWSKKMDVFLQLPLERQKTTQKPVLDNSSSRQWLGKAVDALEQIPMQKGSYARLEEVYYFLAFNQWELGNRKESVKNFRAIAEKFPNSRFAPEAFRYMGDFEFANRDFRESLRYYERAAKFEKSPARPRVLYGLAWSHFKMKNYAKAVAMMSEAIRSGRDNSEAEKAGLALQRDAEDSLALFYSEGGNADQASDYFSKVFGDDEVGPALRKLVSNYQRQGKYAKALAVNKQLINMGGAAAKEGDEQRYEIMMDGMKVAIARSDRAHEAALLKAMINEFVVNAKEPNEERILDMKERLKKAATLAHREGNKGNRPKPAYQRAEELYRLYLSTFSSKIDPEESAEVHTYLADVLSQLGKHKEAAREYQLILDNAKSDKNFKKYEKSSASGLVYSLNSDLKNKKGGADTDATIAAIDQYVQQYPNDKQNPEFLARAAGLLVVAKRNKEAEPRLRHLVESYPSSREAWDAAGTLLKSAEAEKNYEGAEQLARQFIGNQKLMAQDKKGELRKRLESIVARAQFQQVKEVEEDKDFAKAAQGYERLASTAKDGEVRFAALNNAAVSYGKAGDRTNELRLYQKILELQPGNKNAQNVIMGKASEDFVSGRYADAAGMYELYYQLHKKGLKSMKPAEQAVTVEALRSAALLRKALKQNDKAAEDFKEIVDASNAGVSSAREAAGEFLYETAKRLRDEGNVTEATRTFVRYEQLYSDGPHYVEALYELSQLYSKLREEGKSASYLQKTIATAKSRGKKASASDLSLAAHAKLLSFEEREASFERIKLRLPEKQLKADINAKLTALDNLNKAYIEVMDFGDGTWGVEAYRRMALAQRTFAETIEGAPVPAEYSEETKAKYKAQLKNMASPAYAEMLKTLETAMKKAESLAVVGPVSAKVYLMLAVGSARPDRLPLVQTVDWSNASAWISGPIPDGESELEASRQALRKNAGDSNALLAIGNYHLARGEEKFAEIFYQSAIDKNKKNANAISNLAYLKGRNGDIAKAAAGFKAALAHDEFATAPKKNLARLYMASGLWRHAGLALRQLEVRMPADSEVKRGMALSSIAQGKNPESGGNLLGDSTEENAAFARAASYLVKGERESAGKEFESISAKSEYARLVLDFWFTKESGK